jgi:hypothetical protein
MPSDDEEEIKRKSLAYQGENSSLLPEEAGLEEGSYLPGGAEDFIPSPINMVSKIKRGMAAAKEGINIVKAAKGASEDFITLAKQDHFGNNYLFKIPREKFAELKDATLGRLKPFLHEVENKAVKEGKDAAVTDTRTVFGRGLLKP